MQYELMENVETKESSNENLIVSPLQNTNFLVKALDRLPANQRALLIIVLFFMFLISLMGWIELDVNVKGYIIIGMLVIIGLWILKAYEIPKEAG